VDMSACVKFGLDRPSRLAGHTEHRYRQTDKHNAFYYIDIESGTCMPIGFEAYCRISLETSGKRFSELSQASAGRRLENPLKISCDRRSIPLVYLIVFSAIAVTFQHVHFSNSLLLIDIAAA